MNNPLSSSTPLLQLQVPTYRRVHMTLVGCGGTGSHIASGLISLSGSLVERGVDVDVQLIDPDRVEQRNVGRQLFGPANVGRPKAEVLADRLNRAFAARIGYSIRALSAADAAAMADPDAGTLSVVIGAVDNPAARAVIAKAVAQADTGRTVRRLWWIDAGNENHSGQVAIGDTADPQRFRGAGAMGMISRLPAPHLVYPDLVATPQAKKSARRARVPSEPSCAELVAAGEQGLMVNRMAAAWVLAMLDAFFRGDLRHFAVAFDLKFGGARSSAIDAPTISAATGLKAAVVTGRTK